MKSGGEVELINERLITILVIVIAVVLVCLVLILSVIKLVGSTNKDIVAKFNMKTSVNDIMSETNLEIKALDKKEKK